MNIPSWSPHSAHFPGYHWAGVRTVGLLAAAFLLVAGVSAQNARSAESTPDDPEAAKMRESQANPVYKPRAADPDQERQRLERRRLEQEMMARAAAAKDQNPQGGPVEPQRSPGTPAAPAAPRPLAPSGMPADVPRDARGPEHDRLQLSLIPEPHAESAIPGGPEPPQEQPLLVRLVLHNLGTEARRLDGLRACSSLDRADSLEFRIESDLGERIVLPNIYEDIASLHEHAPLVIAGGGQLDGTFDLAELVHVSAEFKGLLERSRWITVVAVVPALGLESRPLETRVAPVSRGQHREGRLP